jgi:hypothetical protein
MRISAQSATGSQTASVSSNGNRKEATEALIEDSQLADIVLLLAEKGINWSGTALNLYTVLTKNVGKKAGLRWPKTMHIFGAELRRIAPQLRLHGISIGFE